MAQCDHCGGTKGYGFDVVAGKKVPCPKCNPKGEDRRKKERRSGRDRRKG